MLTSARATLYMLDNRSRARIYCESGLLTGRKHRSSSWPYQNLAYLWYYFHTKCYKYRHRNWLWFAKDRRSQICSLFTSVYDNAPNQYSRLCMCCAAFSARHLVHKSAGMGVVWLQSSTAVNTYISNLRAAVARLPERTYVIQVLFN